jgi:phosphatidylethanolamine/phosphatidyl-N-methylethanolamine N-methyltransferase
MNEKQLLKDERRLFFRRWLRHPIRLGAVLPSSIALTRMISQHATMNHDGIVVELGGGTGRVTRSLLKAGIPADKLYVLELDPELCAFLKKSMPGVHVILGDARDLPSLIPCEYLGKITTVISGMPMTAMPFEVQRSILQAAFQVMTPEGQFLQYSYRPVSPLSIEKHHLMKKRLGVTFKNVPPATVWQYLKAA